MSREKDHLPGYDMLQLVTSPQKQPAHFIQSLYFSNQRRGFAALQDLNTTADQGVMHVVFPEQLGKRPLGEASQRLPEAPRDGDQRGRGIARLALNTRQRCDAIAKIGRRGGGVEIDVHAQADKVHTMRALAQKAGELAAVVKQVVGPFELDVGVAGEFRGRVTDGNADIQLKWPND